MLVNNIQYRCLSWSQYCTWAATTEPIHEPQTSEHAGMQIGSFLWFFKQVNHNAEWDIKREACWKAALPSVPFLKYDGEFLFRGQKITAEGMRRLRNEVLCMKAVQSKDCAVFVHLSRLFVPTVFSAVGCNQFFICCYVDNSNCFVVNFNLLFSVSTALVRCVD